MQKYSSSYLLLWLLKRRLHVLNLGVEREDNSSVGRQTARFQEMT